MLVISLCIFLFQALVSAEIITLTKDNNTICVLTENDSLNSTLYIEPPFTIDAVSENRQPKIEEDFGGDWRSDNSVNRWSFGPVTDKRWQNFAVLDETSFILTNKFKSFSLYFLEKDSNFSIRDRNFKSINLIPSKIGVKLRTWLHFSAKFESEQLTIEGSEKFTEKLNTTPKITVEKVKVKLHDCIRLYSEYNRKNEPPAQLFLASKTNFCISMYVSVDKGCLLNVKVTVNNQLVENKTIQGFNDETMKSWKQVTLNSDIIGNGTISLFKSTSNEQSKGFWAISDVKYCTKLEIYRSNTSSNNYTCRILDQPNKPQKEKHCKKGFLGEHCNITCTSILGDSYPNCEDHKICINTSCKCASGLKEPNCEKNLPVLLEAPILKALTENSITIALISKKYSQGELTPEFMQIQVKSCSNNTFYNYSDPKKYNKNSIIETFTIKPINKTSKYTIRIVLMATNQFSSKNVPELVVERNLEVSNQSKNSVIFNWKLSPDGLKYILNHKCYYRMCSENTTNNTETILWSNTSKFSILPTFSVCEIQLFHEKSNKRVLLDALNLTFPNTNHLDQSQLPTNITLQKDKFIMHMNKCEDFEDPLTFIASITCVKGKNCENENFENYQKIFGSYINSIEINTNFTLWNEYEFNVTAERFNKSRSKIYQHLIPSSDESTIKNLEVYCRSNNTFWLRWQSLTETILEYKISYENIEDSKEDIYQTNSSKSFCQKWDNYYCVSLNQLKNHATYKISVQPFGPNNMKLGEPITTTNSTFIDAPRTPQNFSLILFSNSSVTLSWTYNNCDENTLKYFSVITKTKQNESTLTVPIEKQKKNYNHSISICHPEELRISVRGVNDLEGENATIETIITTPITNISTTPFAQVCNRKCFLLLPENRTNFELLVIKQANYTKNQILEEYKLAKNKTTPEHWIIKPTNSQLEIGAINGVVSLKNDTFKIYIIANNNSYELQYITNNKQNEISTDNKNSIKLSITNIVVLTVLCFAIIITISLLFCFCIGKKQQPTAKTPFGEESDILIPSTEAIALTERQSLHKCPPDERQSCLIDLMEFQEYIKKSINNVDEFGDNDFTKQYKHIPKIITEGHQKGQSSDNSKKNRYKNLVAYDNTRVILKNYPRGDYINANYIDGYDIRKKYIATQAPLEDTINDFWYMIWQENVSMIIMLTKLKEQNKQKSVKYWPNVDIKLQFGPFFIKNLSTKLHPDYTHRQLKIIYEDQSHFIDHYQYESWPDHGTPNNPENFAKFLKKVSTSFQHLPVVVHCNAGCGRTGTFILCDIILEMIEKEKKIDFVKVLSLIRKQRANLVANVGQYIAAHQIIFECLYEKDFSIATNSLFLENVKNHSTTTAINYLMENIQKASIFYRKYNNFAITDEEKQKNRFSKILPTGPSRLYLSVSSATSSNYINAVKVDCYNCPGKFIVTQQPLDNTIADFWTLIEEYKIDTIVSLNEINNPTMVSCPEFWPSLNQEVSFEKITIKTIKRQISDAYNIITVSVSKDKEQLHKVVRVMLFKDWPRNTWTPLNIENLILLWKKIYKNDTEIVVTCYDGATASGLFVALAYLLEKIDTEHSCDVYSAVKTVRTARSQFVRSAVQCQFLYEAAIIYFHQINNIYSNFR